MPFPFDELMATVFGNCATEFDATGGSRATAVLVLGMQDVCKSPLAWHTFRPASLKKSGDPQLTQVINNLKTLIRQSLEVQIPVYVFIDVDESTQSALERIPSGAFKFFQQRQQFSAQRHIAEVSSKMDILQPAAIGEVSVPGREAGEDFVEIDIIAPEKMSKAAPSAFAAAGLYEKLRFKRYIFIVGVNANGAIPATVQDVLKCDDAWDVYVPECLLYGMDSDALVNIDVIARREGMLPRIRLL